MSGGILAVDPGATSGAWALVDPLGALVSAGDLPVAGSGAQRIVSPPLFAVIIDRFKPAQSVVERVGAMPGQGVASSFKFGRGVGIIEGVLGAKSIPISYVVPAVWKRHFGLSKEKEHARGRAIEIWPASAWLFSRKKDHGRAEAALIALWGVRAAIAAGGEL